MEILLTNLEEKKKKLRNDKYKMGIGNCHAYLMHRLDMVEHLKLIHDETDIKYLRFHGIFDDDMLIIQRLSDYSYYSRMPFSHGIYEYNFLQVKKVLDNVLKTGFKPFVELSFMPSALSKGNKTGLRYKNNICPPKNYEIYKKFLVDFTNFIIEQFGKEEVEKWKFEVWNEPDLSIFFKGSKKEYFKIYKTAYEALKGVDSNLQIGGPSTSKCKWLKDFINFAENNNCKPDFVTTHHYVGDAFGNVFSYKDVINIMSTAYRSKKKNIDISTTIQKFFFKEEQYKKWPKSLFRKMDREAKCQVKDYPLYITEWSTMAVFGSPYHDEKIAASFALKYALEMDDSIEGAFYWCGSDLFEEQFMINKPFFGGFGMVNNEGIAKPVMYAFKILNEIPKEELVLEKNEVDDIDYHLYKGKDDYQLLVFNQDFDYRKHQVHEIRIKIDGEIEEVKLKRIDDNHVNPKKMWIDYGEPKVLSVTQKREIIEKSKLIEENITFKFMDGYSYIDITLYSNDIYLIKFKKKVRC